MKTSIVLSASMLLSALGASETLLDWSAFDTGTIRVIDYRHPAPTTPRQSVANGVQYRKVGENGNSGLELTIRPETNLLTPGILLRPGVKERFWNLSGYQELHAEVENLDSDQQIALRIRVTTSECFGTYQTFIDSGITLNPGEKSVLKLRYSHADTFAPCAMFGIGATPPGIASIRTVDARRVTGIVFFADNPRWYTRSGAMRVKIGNLKLETPRVPAASALSDPGRFYPFIDRYGQYIHEEWPEKIHAQEDFAKNAAVEEKTFRSAVPRWNRFGGLADGPTLKITGFFHPEKYKDKWYLVDPEGKLFFSFGLNSITMGELDLSGTAHPSEWFATPRNEKNGWNFTIGNLTARYGKNYKKVYPETVFRRLNSWGVNTLGNWSSPDFMKAERVPYVTNILPGRRAPRTAALSMTNPDRLDEAPGFRGIWDIFDPLYSAGLRASAARLKKQISPDDSWCIGIMIDNEIDWGHHTGLGDRTAVARSVILSDAKFYAKKELVSFLRNRYAGIAGLNAVWKTHYADWNALLKSKVLPDPVRSREDLIAFNRHFIDTYYRMCRDTVREFFPNHLYLGSRINIYHPDVLEIASRYTDVMTMNVYVYCMDGLRREGLPADKPFIITEFHVGVLDRGMFSAQPRQAGVSQVDRAQAYLRIMEGLLLHPQAVGAHYFCYRDQPNTGRRGGPWQENYATGVIDKCDIPYQPLADAMRLAAEKGLDYRMNAPLPTDLKGYSTKK